MIHRPQPSTTDRAHWHRPTPPGRRRRLLSLLVGATLAAGACDGSASSRVAPKEPTTVATSTASPDGPADVDPTAGLVGTVIVLGVPTDAYPPAALDAIGIDPANAGFDVLTATANLLWDSLTAVDEHGDAQPAAALSWSTSDAMTWVFHLDPAARYHDGTAVVAADFAEGIRRLSTHPEFPLHYLGEPISGWGTDTPGVRAVDAHTLEIVTAEASPLLPEIIANPVFSPRPTRAAGDAIPPQNGPYQVVSQRGLTVVTERNPHHHATALGADHVVVRPFASHDAWVEAMRDETIDVAFVTSGELEALALPPERVARSPIEAVSYLELLDQSKPALRTPAMRQALSLAIDRDALLAAELPGEHPATGYVPGGWPGAKTDACPACAFDPAGARRKLAEAGVDPATVTIKLGAYHEPRVERIADMWRTGLGITVEVDNEGPDPEAIDVALSGWFPDYPDAASYLAAALARLYPPLSATTTDLLHRSITTADEPTRLQVLGEAQQALATEMINIPLTFVAFPSFVSGKIDVLPFDGMGVPMLGDVIL